MAKKTTKEKIKKIIEATTSKPDVQKVILFGSHAYGQPDKDSDVDLLFITNSKLKGLQRYRWINANLSHIFPMDILVKTPAEIKKRIMMGDPFYKEIMKRGKVLYEST